MRALSQPIRQGSDSGDANFKTALSTAAYLPAHAAFVGGFIIVSAVVISIFGDRWLNSRKAQVA